MKKRPVKQYDLDGNFIKEYKSLTEAMLATGIPQGTIGSAIMYGYVTHGKFRWSSDSN